MATQTEEEQGVRVSTLLAEIAEDARRLFVEQMTLFQVEIKNDVKRAVRALIPVVAGAVALVPAILLLGMGGAYGLCWLFPDLPTWAGFAIVGGTIALVGGALLWWGIESLRAISPLPDTALRGLKENIQWKTKN